MHKGIKIAVDNSGDFVFYFDCKMYKNSSLYEAKEEIDNLTRDYYNFTYSDYNNMLNKLNARERDFVNTICKELGQHEYNAYCERSVEIDFNFDFDKLLKN